MDGSNPANSPKRGLLPDFAEVAASLGGRRHHPWRMLPATCWTFDVALRRPSGEIPLGRWSFGIVRGPELATAAPMHRLGHSGEFRFAPVGWPSAAYVRERNEITREIRAKTAVG